MQATPPIWTVGHSNHEARRFLDLLASERIEFVIDVRSYPYSSFAPHFNRDELQSLLARAGMQHVFMGDALGGRPDDEAHYDSEGHALYGPMAAQPAFQAGIERVLRGSADHRLALMCSCGWPRECHRRLLVGKVLCERGAELRHILPDGRVQVERTVDVAAGTAQAPLFGQDDTPWRSTRSVSHRRRLSTSSPA